MSIFVRSSFRPRSDKQTRRACLQRAFYIQSALFITSYALAMLWKSWGVEPESVLGYSIGEIVAGTVAGVISLPDAVRMTGERSRMMQQLPMGRWWRWPSASKR